MGVDKVSRLLRAFHQSSSAENSQVKQAEQSAVAQNSPAVSLAPGFGSSASEVRSDRSRSDRVAELKKQVTEGTYKPDSTKVAEAVARELFA